MSTLICSFDGLHDNRVLRCCADFEAHTLHMDTQSETGEKVSVRFTGLLAHWFENVVQDNILFGMDEITVDLSLIHIWEKSRSTGLLSRIYQYRNFEIGAETDTMGVL